MDWGATSVCVSCGSRAAAKRAAHLGTFVGHSMGARGYQMGKQEEALQEEDVEVFVGVLSGQVFAN